MCLVFIMHSSSLLPFLYNTSCCCYCCHFLLLIFLPFCRCYTSSCRSVFNFLFSNLYFFSVLLIFCLPCALISSFTRINLCGGGGCAGWQWWRRRGRRLHWHNAGDDRTAKSKREREILLKIYNTIFIFQMRVQCSVCSQVAC